MVPGSFSNIFKDFYTSGNSVSGQKTAFEVSRYIISSSIAKNLSNENKEILLELLSIYLWLINPVVSREEVETDDSLPNAETLEADRSLVNRQSFVIPQEILQPAAPKLPPVVPAPKNMPTLRSMGDVGSGGIKNPELRIKENNSSTKPSVAPSQQVPYLTFPKIQTNPLPQVRPGLSMLPQESYQMPKKENLVEDIQQKIDKKLEDLEKRIK
jgi:hypothetical protein